MKRLRAVEPEDGGIEPIELSYDEIPGVVSKRALKEHYKLYVSYIDTLNRIDEKIIDTDLPEKPLLEHPFRSLKLAETTCLGSILLHETYFQNFSDQHAEPDPDSNLYKSIVNIWDNIESWWMEMRATAMEARAWAVLAACEIDPLDMRILMLDWHDIGGLTGWSPIFVLDVVDHSYWTDFPNQRGEYVDGLVQFINWPQLEASFDELIERSGIDE